MNAKEAAGRILKCEARLGHDVSSAEGFDPRLEMQDLAPEVARAYLKTQDQMMDMGKAYASLHGKWATAVELLKYVANSEGFKQDPIAQKLCMGVSLRGAIDKFLGDK